MSVREVRTELESRGLAAEGTRSELERRLAAAMVAEAAGESTQVGQLLAPQCVSLHQTCWPQAALSCL